MNRDQRMTTRFFLIFVMCLGLLACQFLGQLGVPAFQEPTPTPTETPLPSPTDIPSPTVTDTPLPSATATPLPSSTQPPTRTPVPVTDTPDISIVTIVNNLNKPAKFIFTGPSTKGVIVQAHSKFTFEILPGTYNYQMTATNFKPANGTITFPPGTFTWTWGKAKP